jgi:hypothetical protein
MAGEFAQLIAFKWRGEHYPVTRVGVSLAHDLVEHKYWGVDGGRVEATGVAPIRVSATIPISNHIVPGGNEGWESGKLYPTALRKFIVDFSKRLTGLVQHPEFGEIACKPERFDFELTGERQGATEIHASWVETLDDDVLTNLVASPVQQIQGVAADLDADVNDLRSLAPTLPEFKESLEDLARKLAGMADALTILSYRAAGAINNVIYQVRRIETAVMRAKDATTWPVIQNIQRLKSAAYELRTKALSPGGIGLYVVPKDLTMAGVVVALPKGTNVGDLIKLNPNLARGPVVPKGTYVRYPLQG